MSMLRRIKPVVPMEEIVEEVVEVVVETDIFTIDYESLSYRDLQKFAERVEDEIGVELDRSAKKAVLLEDVGVALASIDG